ncbi:transglycosylase SLT domain-containing protein [Amycolatopsis sp. NPDC051061]|uniref:transglycosylase SLT domain-containing protein n=1 Tax=Amycolatopsis sp. NPDC051061 TaxID=3155042 RepID=UPI00343EC0E1
MTKLSAEQIARHAYAAGFRGQGLTTAVAVALAESGGRTTAHNATPPDDSYGLWQINMLGALGPERRHQYHLKADDRLFDPDTNARVANSISSDGRDFTPWSTYTNGAYKDHLTAARKAAQDVTKHHGKPSSSHTAGGDSPLRVDDTILHSYVSRTRHVADALGSATGQLRDVREIGHESFGKVGEESGFADALAGFGSALQKQVKGVGTHADGLATAARKAAKSYRDHETATAAALNGMG